MKKFLGNAKGFTLIELMVVIIIIGVLASISVPIYKQYVNKARAAEGQALCGAVASAEKVYFAEHNAFLAVAGGGGAADVLNVVATQNTYYTSYDATLAPVGGFTVTCVGAGDAAGVTVKLVQAAAGAAVITVTGL